MMSSNLETIRPAPTFYKTQSDLDTALIATVGVFVLSPNVFSVGEDGYVSIESICLFLKQKQPHLNYINRNHIIEFFFKDKGGKISFKNEDYLKYENGMHTKLSDILHAEEITASLFQSQNDLKAALITTVHLLRDNLASLPRDKEGYYHITNICETLKKRMPFLYYINKNHIVELFFKDRFRNIIFKNDTYLKYKLKVYKDPPEELFLEPLQTWRLK